MRVAMMMVALLLPAQALAQVTTETDRFTGKTTLSYSSKKGLSHPSAGNLIFKAFRVQKPEAAEENFLFVSYTGRSWRYLRCESVHWLLDGKPLQLPKPLFSRDTMRGGVSEILIQPFSREQLQEMASASTLEVKICNDEITFPAEDIAGLKELSDAAP